MRNKLLKFVFLFFILACGDDKINKQLKEVDVSDINLNVQLKRFEQDLFSIPSDSLPEAIHFLQKKYGKFYHRFNQNIINIGPSNSPSYPQYLNSFINDPDIKAIYKDVEKTYSNFNPFYEDLNEAFKRYNHYFPEKTIPEIITFLSGFNYFIVVDDSILALGLDMYLGKDYKLYQMLPQLPKYFTLKMRKENLVPDAMQAWVSSEFPDSGNTRLISRMIYQGKIMYLMDALLPETEDSLKIGYTSEQMNWVEKNEDKIWRFFIDNKLLFSTKAVENDKFFVEGPFTSGLPQESSPKTGTWIGWQIVREYMKNNPQIKISQLMQEKDAQMILTRSKYKPKK